MDALVFSTLAAARAMVRSFQQLRALGRDRAYVCCKLEDELRENASTCLCWLLTSPWYGATALRAGGARLLGDCYLVSSFFSPVFFFFFPSFLLMLH